MFSPLGECLIHIMGWFCQFPGNFCLYFRSYRLFRTIIFVGLLLFYCEFLHYYVVLFQCTWPQVNNEMFDRTLPPKFHPLRVMVIADTHVMGPHAHWFDRLRREWQMEQAFQTSMLIHSPDVVFVLGDLLDEGKWCSDSEFQRHVKRFQKMFSTNQNTDMYVLVGNHDIGFHYAMTPHKERRFEKAFNAPSVKMLHIRDNIFVLVNSMTLEGDGCSLCQDAVSQLQQVSQQLRCAQDPLKSSSSHNVCHQWEQFTYTKPILLQHYPMFRTSDIDCDTSDAAPLEEKGTPFKPKWDCLSQDATEQMFSLLDPRLVISAHTHHGCYRVHKGRVPEWTIPSFNWRNKNNPSFLLATISNDKYEVKRCHMPRETTVITLYIIWGLFILLTLPFPRRVIKFNTDKAH
ncbi:metallophosphoesterase 1-like [Haliotis rubra]|uniref:metallophosphoesterase 1-like n=1 Tax=Haliotis rubra TaxID=36100 RepID=UPI001EE4FEA6|nr:metallophosphoesterase 1-like [Haliotis rubra]